MFIKMFSKVICDADIKILDFDCLRFLIAGVGYVFERGFLHSFKLKNTLKRAVMERGGRGGKKREGGHGSYGAGDDGEVGEKEAGKQGEGMEGRRERGERVGMSWMDEGEGEERAG